MKKAEGLAVGVLGVAATALFLFGTAAGQNGPQRRFSEGRKLFIQYCAPCHGRDAKGGGPVAPTLKVAPPDLTAIQVKGERFPAGRITDLIEGEKVIPAHGNRTMPVWGKIFREERGYSQAQEDILALVKYLQSIQNEKP